MSSTLPWSKGGPLDTRMTRSRPGWVLMTHETYTGSLRKMAFRCADVGSCDPHQITRARSAKSGRTIAVSYTRAELCFISSKFYRHSPTLGLTSFSGWASEPTGGRNRTSGLCRRSGLCRQKTVGACRACRLSSITGSR